VTYIPIAAAAIAMKVIQPRQRTRGGATAWPMAAIAGHKHDQQNEWRRQHAIHYRGPEQLYAPFPTKGSSAWAACFAVSISVFPCACKVAAVVKMMKYMITFEKSMPVSTSVRSARSSPASGTFSFPRGRQTIRTLIFNFVGCTPKEEIRRDRRSQYGHQNGKGLAVPADMTNETGYQHRVPIRLSEERGHYISEERQSKPFEDSHDGPVR